MPLIATKEEQDSYVNEIASKMSYVDIRKKGRVDISGILTVVNHFRSYGIDFDISESAHKIPSILEEFLITDIHYNGYRIDVITAFQNDVVSIPKKHFEYDITPDFYYIINLKSDLSTFKTLGFLRPDDVLKSKSDSNYYYPKEYNDATELVALIKKPNAPKNVIGNHKDCEALFLRFLDKELSYSYKKSFIRHLLSCRECLEKFRYLDSFNNLAKSVTDYPELTEKYYKKATGQLTNSDSDVLDKKIKIQNAVTNTKIFVKEVLNKLSNIQFKKEKLNFLMPKNEEECIDLIFNGEEQKEKFDISTVFKKRKFKALLIIPLLVISLIVFGVIKSSAGSNEQELPQEEFIDEDFQQITPFDDDMSQMWNGEISEPGEISQLNIHVNKVSWEIPKKLSGNDMYIKFLQIAGKNIQINLENDLLVVRDVPTNHSIKVNVLFKNYGSIVSLKTIKGSGSDEIDTAIEKTVFNAFSYVRPPKTDLKNVDLTLLIEL